MANQRMLVNTLGTSEKIISGEPKMTYMAEVFKKKSRCSNQLITMQFNINSIYGSESLIELYQEGDLIDGVWLRLNYPVGQPTAVVDSFGTEIIDWVQLEYGDKVIERLYGEFILFINDLDTPIGKASTLQNMTGRATIISLTTYTIKLPFSAFKQGLPICALSENVKIRFNLNTFKSVCTDPAAKDPQIFNATLLVNYIFLDDIGKDELKNNKLDYLLEQTQFASYNLVPNFTSKLFNYPIISLKTDTSCIFAFSNPIPSKIKVVMTFTGSVSATTYTFNSNSISPDTNVNSVATFTIDSGILDTNTIAYSGVSPTNVIVQISGFQDSPNPISIFTAFRNSCKELYISSPSLTGLRIVLDDKEYLKTETATSMFLSTYQGFYNYSGQPNADCFMYPFCLDPYKVSGSINFGMVQRQQFDFYVKAESTVNMYMRSYNIMQIQDGNLDMLYYTPTDITL